MFRSTFTLIVLLYAITLSAQNEVKGVIIDKSTDFPIIGATVLIKDTSIGTTTNFDGNFILPNVPDGATLVFSYLGFVSQELSSIITIFPFILNLPSVSWMRLFW